MHPNMYSLNCCISSRSTSLDWLLTWFYFLRACVRVCVCAPACMYTFMSHCMHTEVRCQPAGVISVLSSWGSWGLNQVIGFGREHLYPLSNLSGPHFFVCWFLFLSIWLVGLGFCCLFEQSRKGSLPHYLRMWLTWYFHIKIFKNKFKFLNGQDLIVKLPSKKHSSFASVPNICLLFPAAADSWRPYGWEIRPWQLLQK